MSDEKIITDIKNLAKAAQSDNYLHHVKTMYDALDLITSLQSELTNVKEENGELKWNLKQTGDGLDSANAEVTRLTEGFEIFRTLLQQIKIAAICEDDDEANDHVTAREFISFNVDKILKALKPIGEKSE